MRRITLSLYLLVLLGLATFILPVACETTKGTTNPKLATIGGDDDEEEDDDEVVYHYDHDGEDGEFNHEDDLEDMEELKIEDMTLDSFTNAVVMNDFSLVLHLDADKEEANQKYEQFFEAVHTDLFSDRTAIIANLGRLGVEEQKQIAKEFKPTTTPAFVLYDHSRPFIYDGELSSESFVKWVDEIMAREIRELKTAEDLENFIAGEGEVKVVAFYNDRNKDEKEVETLEGLVHESYLVRQGVRKVAFCFEGCPNQFRGEHFKRNSLAIFRSFDKEEPFVALEKDLGDFQAVFNFCHLESMPPFLVYDEINQTRIFDEALPVQVILIADPDVDNSALIDEFRNHALLNRHESPKNERLLHVEYLYHENSRGLKWLIGNQTLSHLPKLFVTEATEELDQINKYQLPNDQKITAESIKEFITKFRARQLERFYISEPVPTDNEGKLVKTIVGKTYAKEVLQSPENVIVYVCPGMDSELCKDKFEIFQNAAKKVSEKSKFQDANLKFSSIDVAVNEATVNDLEFFPHIMFLKSGNKDDQKVFQPDFTEAQLENWITNWFPVLKKKIDEEL